MFVCYCKLVMVPTHGNVNVPEHFKRTFAVLLYFFRYCIWGDGLYCSWTTFLAYPEKRLEAFMLLCMEKEILMTLDNYGVIETSGLLRRLLVMWGRTVSICFGVLRPVYLGGWLFRFPNLFWFWSCLFLFHYILENIQYLSVHVCVSICNYFSTLFTGCTCFDTKYSWQYTVT